MCVCVCVCVFVFQVQYQRGLQEVKGRSCSEFDTPEMRRVRKSQDSVSMVAGPRRRLRVTSPH